MEPEATNDLRNRIWDYLFTQDQPQPIALIADQMNAAPDTIQTVVSDPWFDLRDGRVAIARNDR